MQIANALEILSIAENALELRILGILSTNRREWLLVDVACMGVGVVTVGLSDKDSDEQLAYKLQKLHLKYLCTDKSGFQQIMKIKKNRLADDLEFIFCLDNLEDSEKKLALEYNLKVFNFRDFKNFENKPVTKQIDPKSVCMLSFTSGTTGPEKLVKISHENLLGSFTSILNGLYELSSEDVHLTTTHLSVLSEKILIYIATISGASIGISNQFQEDLKIVRPTILFGLPRYLDFLYVQMQEEIASHSNLMQKLFRKSFNKKLSQFMKGEEIKKSIWDNVIFKSIREKLGNRVRLIFTGTSIANSETLRFFKIILGCDIIESYGLTEAGEFSFCAGSDKNFGHVGGPLATCEAKLVYTANIELEGLDPLKYGELYLKNTSIPLGYVDEPNTDSDGWIKTGDLFKFIDGIDAFQFIDRIDYIIKLKNGKSVSPQLLEMMYRQSDYVAQVLVYGDNRTDGLVAVVVPDERYVMKHNDQKHMSFRQLCENTSFYKTILKDFEGIALDKGKKSYEKIKEIYIEPIPWTSQEYITNTLKLKRNILITRYQSQINEMMDRLIHLV